MAYFPVRMMSLLFTAALQLLRLHSSWGVGQFQLYYEAEYNSNAGQIFEVECTHRKTGIFCEASHPLCFKVQDVMDE